MAKDSFFYGRMTHEQQAALSKMVTDLQAKNPQGSITLSSIARHALERYVQQYQEERDDTGIFIHVPTIGLTAEDQNALINKLLVVSNECINSGMDTAASVIDSIISAFLKRRAGKREV